jgi:uncharacterized protein
VTAQQTFWRRWWAALFALVAAALPLLALIPLGGVWLWQQGYVLWWLAAALVLGAGGYACARWLQREARAADAAADSLEQRMEPVSPPDDDWSPHDLDAWAMVQRLASDVDPHIIGDSDRLLETATHTIEIVARHYHPTLREPVWRFTLPEALLLTERVSARLRVVLLTSVPGSHLIRAGQLRRIWQLKPAAETGMRMLRHAQRAWRFARLVNPMAALLAEARDQLVSAALGETGHHLRRKGARIWVEEVGRAAIELYSGRLRLDAAELAAHARRTPGLGREAPLPGPIHIVVAGQTKAGKSSLVNALLGDIAAGVDVLPLTENFTRYELTREGAPEAVIVDSPGMDDEASTTRTIDAAREADCLIWVVAAHRADRALDRSALEAVRAWFAAWPERPMPPVLVVVTHIDRLSPAREWSPPYDVANPQRQKEVAIREALDVIAADLGVPPPDVVPTRLQPTDCAYNVDLVWALLAQRFDAAQRGRAIRVLRSVPQHDWKRLLGQAAGAGRLLAGKLGR